MSLCDCAFGPRCESNGGCEDATATMGIKCPRMGTIRARADWSIFLPGRQPPATRTPPRPRFYCTECLEALREAISKPLLGIDQPKHADEDWKPSITEHIRLTRIKNEHTEKMREASEAMKFAAFSEKPMTARERAMTPERWKQTLFIRQKFREYAQRS